MKLSISLFIAIALVLACGSDVTGPGENPPPDTTTYYEVLYHISTSDSLPHEMYIAAYIDNASEWVNFDTTVADFEYEFQAVAGDSLHVSFCTLDSYEWITASISVDGDWVASNGGFEGFGSAGYRIP